MIFVFEMADFVNNDISDELRWEVDKIEIEWNMLVWRATSPLGMRNSDDEFVIFVINNLGIFVE